MSPRRQGVSVDTYFYLVYVVMMWLGGGVRFAAGIPCAQEEVDYNIPSLDTYDICPPGDTCKTDCTPQDKNFKCSVQDETGWRQYENHYQTSYFSLANVTGPELEAISIHHKKYNATGRTYFRPALSITINISAQILGISADIPNIPEALLVRVSGVNDTDSVRDDFYTDTPLYRLYNFRNYTPTSRDIVYPRQAILKCIDRLDACAVKVYRLEITAFVPKVPFMTRMVYTITAPNNRSRNLPPVIATAVHPGGDNVTVVFETGGGARVTSVALVRVNRTQVLYIQRVPPETNRVWFQSVTGGMYTAVIEIAGTSYHSHPFCVGNPEQLDEDCFSNIEDMSDLVREPPNVLLILASLLFLLFLCTMVAVVLYRNKQRLTRLMKNNNQTPQVENITRILLLNRIQDQQTANILKDHADIHFPGIKFVSVQEPETEMDSPNNKLIGKAVKLCDHIAVIWSPSNVKEKDDFEETITNESMIAGSRNVDLSVIFPSDPVDNNSLPVELNGAHKFSLKTELQAFFQHCSSQSSELPDSLQNFHESPSVQKINGSYTNISVTMQDEDEEFELLAEKQNWCPVHGRKDKQDSNFNINRSESEIWQIDSQQDQLAYTNCPVHGTRAQPEMDSAFESKTNLTIENKFLWLNDSSLDVNTS